MLSRYSLHIKLHIFFCEKSEYSIDLKNKNLYTILIQKRKAVIAMNYNTNVKHTTLEDFVTTVNDLGVELVIEEALRQGRKKQLLKLIDEALINKNEEAFINYTNEYKNLEAFLNE